MNVGQSERTVSARRRLPIGVTSLAVFPTNLGWFGLVGANRTLQWMQIGHASAVEVRRAARQFLTGSECAGAIRENDWCPSLRDRLERYTLGEEIDFDDVALALPEGSDFQRSVLKVVRRIPYGKTISYGALATKAGYPRAARAVGTVMSSNRFPIIIPCHRVVASGDKPGGYTSPRGVSLKLQLLALERDTTTG